MAGTFKIASAYLIVAPTSRPPKAFIATHIHVMDVYLRTCSVGVVQFMIVWDGMGI